jgi:hypothetical protein
MIMRFKTIFAITCVLSSVGASSYFAYQYGQNKTKEKYNNALHDYQGKIEESEGKIKAILGNLPSEFYLIKGKAEEALGGGSDATDMLKLFALNGTNECASSEAHSKAFRCTEAEEAAVMYSVYNRFKTGRYKNYEEVIKEKGQYSWTEGGLQTATEKTPSFTNSLKIASYILSGSNKYEQYNFGQTHYCKSYYTKTDKNGKKHTLNGCGWHNSEPDLIHLGRMHIKDADVPKVRILDADLSFHHFYKEKGESK